MLAKKLAGIVRCDRDCLQAGLCRYNARMAYDLALHPNCTCEGIERIAVDVVQSPTALSIQFSASGDMTKLRVPTRVVSTRADELWQHTCFEAFIAVPDDAGYVELNFSPSTQWAAYRFTGYREGMAVAEDIQAPIIDVQCDERLLTMTATLQSIIPVHSDSIQLALSAVIEQTNGHKSYWALAHPGSKADFHHRDGFIIKLE
jgi:hypothetical protein